MGQSPWRRFERTPPPSPAAAHLGNPEYKKRPRPPRPKPLMFRIAPGAAPEAPGLGIDSKNAPAGAARNVGLNVPAFPQPQRVPPNQRSRPTKKRPRAPGTFAAPTRTGSKHRGSKRGPRAGRRPQQRQTSAGMRSPRIRSPKQRHTSAPRAASGSGEVGTNKGSRRREGVLFRSLPNPWKPYNRGNGSIACGRKCSRVPPPSSPPPPPRYA